MSRSRVVVVGLLGAFAAHSVAHAEYTAALEWVVDGQPGTSFDASAFSDPNEVVIGLRGSWTGNPDAGSGLATAFGAANNLMISITGDSGTSWGDSATNPMRTTAFDFGPAQNNGSIMPMTDRFDVSGINPAQNQFAAFEDTSNPSGIFWQVTLSLGDLLTDRVIQLDITGLENVLLFTDPFEPAIDIAGDGVGLPSATISIPSPPAWLGSLVIPFTAGYRRRRLPRL